MSAPDLGASDRPRRLSELLDGMRLTFADRRATLREVVRLLEGRAYTLLIVIFALPFVAPVSVPGSSTPLGLVIASVAVQLAVGRLPWLPKRVLDSPLPAGFFTKLVPVTAKIVKALERVLHPRWLVWTATRSVRAFHLFAIAGAALLLALPIVVPFTNMTPGWVILLLGCGLLERDGIALLVGYLVFAATLTFFTLIGSALTEGVVHGWHWLFP